MALKRLMIGWWHISGHLEEASALGAHIWKRLWSQKRIRG